MTLKLFLPAALVNWKGWFRGVPAPIDAISPEPVDDLAALRRITGLSERVSADSNLLEFRSTRPEGERFAWTFRKE